MKCLTVTECSDWLSRHGIAEEPYGRKSKSLDHCFQFEPPTDAAGIMSLVRCLIGNQGKLSNEWEEFGGILGKFEGGLIIFEDWETYPPDMICLITSIRQAHGEKRGLSDAPGHLFEGDEDADVISQCYLIIMFGWTAYLCLALKRATLLFWEGDLIDFWSADEDLLDAVKLSVQKNKTELMH
jgi:hypothetical protein